MTKPKPKTFQELYDIIKPTEPIELWSPEEKRHALLMSTHPTATVDDIIEAMGCRRGDWSDTEKAIIAKKLGKV